MNLSNNRVSATLSGEEIEALRSLIRQIQERMPFLLTLTAREKQLLQGIQIANKQFVEDAIELMHAHKDTLPPHIIPEETRKDYALFNALDVLIFELDSLYKTIKDTQYLAGAEAFHTAIGFYRFINMARKSGVPGAEAAYNQLRVRFSGKSSDSPQDTQADEEIS